MIIYILGTFYIKVILNFMIPYQQSIKSRRICCLTFDKANAMYYSRVVVLLDNMSSTNAVNSKIVLTEVEFSSAVVEIQGAKFIWTGGIFEKT